MRPHNVLHTLVTLLLITFATGLVTFSLGETHAREHQQPRRETCNAPEGCAASGNSHPPVNFFQTMRLVHEGMRHGVNELNFLLGMVRSEASNPTTTTSEGKVDYFGKFRADLSRLVATLSVHAASEEMGMFPLFDELFSGMATRERFVDEHREEFVRITELERKAAALRPSEDAAGLDSLAKDFHEWKESFESHLLHEEAQMQSQIPLVAETLEQRNAVFVRRILNPILGEPDFALALGYLLERLSKYGSTDKLAPRLEPHECVRTLHATFKQGINNEFIFGRDVKPIFKQYVATSDKMRDFVI